MAKVTDEVVSKPRKTLSEELDLPAPPPPGEMPAGENSSEGACDAEIDPELFAGIPDTAPVIEKGISEFRIESYKEGKAAGTDEPYFNVTLTCQTEPHVGRKIFDFVPWVKDEVAKDAKNTSSPTCAASRNVLKDRLWKSNSIMKSAKWKPSGAVSFKAFLATNPVVKVQHKVAFKSTKTDKIDPKTGKAIYEKTTDREAVVDKYLPIT